MIRFSRGGWLPCLLVALVLAHTERLAGQEPPPTAASAPSSAAPPAPPPAVPTTAPPPAAASAPPSEAQTFEPEHRRRRRLARAERRRQRQEARARPTDARTVIGVALMIVGGTMVIGSAMPVVLPALLGGDRPDFSTSRSVVLAAGAMTLGIGAVLLIVSLSNGGVRHYAWSTLPPPTAASGAPSMVLLRF